jgi:hypothetical protein
VLVRDSWPVRKASAEEAAHYLLDAWELGVLQEWMTLGHLDGVPFPGLARVNYLLEDGCTKNPDYLEPIDASRY